MSFGLEVWFLDSRGNGESQQNQKCQLHRIFAQAAPHLHPHLSSSPAVLNVGAFLTNRLLKSHHLRPFLLHPSPSIPDFPSDHKEIH